jgi:hypothetical protein
VTGFVIKKKIKIKGKKKETKGGKNGAGSRRIGQGDRRFCRIKPRVVHFHRMELLENDK